ncbi:MAG TPA: SCO family protein [Thermohalobaculum sp.]|nr:SCO family protein [Thermohalobaculum sp.]
MRNLILALAGAVFVALAAAAIFLALHKPEDAPLSPAAVNVAGAEIGGPFTLTDQNGNRVASAEVIDGPTLIYFGYTFCPDVCPVDVAIMASAVDLLDQQGYRVKPVFITVDPARDTPEAMGYYAEAMHPRMIGLTGTEAEIEAAADAYKVYFQRVDLENSAAGYLMNHSTLTYFMMPDGIRGLFRNGFPPEEMAGEVARILSRE